MSSASGHHFWRKRKKTKSTVPDRWQNYVPYGKPIPNSRFIAFKVPLRSDVAIPESNGFVFTPSNMLEAFSAADIDVGLIVDLTFTKKYYGPEVIEGLFGGRGIAYHKIFTEGHEIPKADHVKNFQTVVDQFLDHDPHRLVGVHCTHGLNRTGYMVCRYLIERLGWNPDHAIAAFDEARGHAQERQNYLDDLRKLTVGGQRGEHDGNGNGNDSSPSTRDQNGHEPEGSSTKPPDLRSSLSRQRGITDSKSEQSGSGVWDRLGPPPQIPNAGWERDPRSSGGSIYPRHPPSGPQPSGRSDAARYRGYDPSASHRHHPYDASSRHSISHHRPPYDPSARHPFNAPSRGSPHDPSRYSNDFRQPPYAEPPPNRPVFQPYQRQDPYRSDHRKKPSGSSNQHSRGANHDKGQRPSSSRK